MEPVPRFSVVLSASAHPERVRLLRLLVEQFRVVALRSDARGTFSAVHERRPDVLVCDEVCSRTVLELVEAGDRPPSTWVVLLGPEVAHGLPHGLTRVPPGASDRRLLAGVATAGRFARTGVPRREGPPTRRFVPAGPRPVTRMGSRRFPADREASAAVEPRLAGLA